MVATNSFNVQFWLFTIGLIFFWAIIISSASPSSTTLKKSLAIQEKASRKHERDCKSLCKFCGCMGFYCGEECICECNNDHADKECLASMQSNAQSLKIPFQLLIQGSSSNNFVRKALKYSEDKYGLAASTNIAVANRNKRSTALIYRPNSLTTHPDAMSHKLSNTKNESSQRPKRSVGQLDWFNDIANSLVRPAPLNKRKKSSQSMNSDEKFSQTQYKRSSNRGDMDRSWFAENPNLLIRPAPLFKRQRNQQAERDNGVTSTRHSNHDEDSSSYESPIEAFGKVPKVLTEAFRSLQDSDAVNELSETLTSPFKEGANVFKSQLGDGNLELLPTGGAIRDTLSEIFQTKNEKEEKERPKPFPLLQKAANGFTWFRPVRFLHRVHQAIN